MRIDAHVHISDYKIPGASLDACFELLKKDMAAAGITAAIIIPDNIENLPNIADLNRARDIIQGQANLFLLGSPQILERGSAEAGMYAELLERRIIRGLKFFTGHDAYLPNDERCIPFFEACSKLKAPVVFHTGENLNGPSTSRFNDPKYLVEIASLFPKLKIVLTHMFWPKMEYCWETVKGSPNIYLELAAVAHPVVLERSGGREKIRRLIASISEQASDRIIFGSDWPMAEIQDHIDLLDVPKEVAEKIYWRNANRVYDLGY